MACNSTSDSIDQTLHESVDWLETYVKNANRMTSSEAQVSEHANVVLMRRTLDAFRSGDIPTLAEVFSKDIVWRVPGNSFLSKDYKGQEDVFGFFGRLMELTAGTFRVESVDIMANDEGGVFVDRLSAERNGRTLDLRLALHVTIRNGQIVEGVDHFHHEHLWDAFWA